jgi:hypothetical protein
LHQLPPKNLALSRVTSVTLRTTDRAQHEMKYVTPTNSSV